MKPKVKNIFQQYNGIQLLLLTMYGTPKAMDDVDNELDRRALKEFKGQDHGKPEFSTCSWEYTDPRFFIHS